MYIVEGFIPGQTLQAWLRRLADEHKIVALAGWLVDGWQIAVVSGSAGHIYVVNVDDGRVSRLANDPGCA